MLVPSMPPWKSTTIPVCHVPLHFTCMLSLLTIHAFLSEKARWAVTNRTNIAKVLEATGTSITTKGTFYPPGKTPGPGQDPKLYILVEGDTELVVTNAMRELRRLLAEGTAAAVDSESRAPASSRYSVV